MHLYLTTNNFIQWRCRTKHYFWQIEIHHRFFMTVYVQLENVVWALAARWEYLTWTEQNSCEIHACTGYAIIPQEQNSDSKERNWRRKTRKRQCGEWLECQTWNPDSVTGSSPILTTSLHGVAPSSPEFNAMGAIIIVNSQLVHQSTSSQLEFLTMLCSFTLNLFRHLFPLALQTPLGEWSIFEIKLKLKTKRHVTTN